MSRAYMFKQDPSNLEVQTIRLSYTPFRIRDGPSDERVAVDAGNRVKVRADSHGDFLIERTSKEEKKAFDAVHVFMVIRQILTMYDRSLERLAQARVTRLRHVQWHWGTDSRIKVFPHAGMEKNAYYSREGKSLKFFYFPSKRNESKVVYTARSYAVIAHEVGHAILDGMLPGYLESWQPQTAALHEAFGDITVILGLVAQLDQCEAFIAHSKGDLHAKKFFSAVAEQFCDTVYGHRMGLRSADNDKKLDQVSDDIHELSQVFTGVFYDIMADMFELRHDSKQFDDAHVLWEVGQYMTDLLLSALLKGPPDNATFADIASLMLKFEKNKEKQIILRHQFSLRRILGPNAVEPPRKLGDEVTTELWETCRCAMSTTEHLDVVDSVLERKRQQQSGWLSRGRAKPAKGQES